MRFAVGGGDAAGCGGEQMGRASRLGVLLLARIGKGAASQRRVSGCDTRVESVAGTEPSCQRTRAAPTSCRWRHGCILTGQTPWKQGQREGELECESVGPWTHTRAGASR